MIYLRLAGGLGNQLYQLAAASLVGKNTNQKVVLLTDALSFYAQHRSPDSLRLISSTRIASSTKEFPKGAIRWLVINGRAGRWLPVVGINDRSGLPASQTQSSKFPYIMDGYFQRGWSASTLADAIAEFEVTFPYSVDPKRVRAEECVIHIRGGDFLSHDIHQVVDENYYVAAMLKAQTSGWSQFAVMSDDLSHAKKVVEKIGQQFPNTKMRIITPAPDALDDFVTLKNARARIIGNSTFAWWAAALDVSHSETWSPSKFLRGIERDFSLDWENILRV